MSPISHQCTLIIEGNLEAKLPTIWTDEKQRWKESEKRREEKRREEERERVRRKKIQVREKVGKSRNIAFFQWFEAPEGRKVGSLKRRVRSQLARWEVKNCAPLWRETHFQVKMHKAHHARTTFGSCDVEKVHADVARSTFASEKAKNTSRSDPFWKLRCRKSACRCGAKHVSKSKCTKHTSCGPLLEVAMSKKCTPLWREAHFEVKMYKTPFGPLLDVQMSFRVAGARDCGPCQKWAKREGFVAFSTKTTTTLHSTTLHYTTTTPRLHSTTLHYITLRSTTLHPTPLHYTTPHYATLHYSTLH